MKPFFLSFLLITILQTGYSQNRLKIFGHISIGPELNRNIRLSDNSDQPNYDRFLLRMNFGFKYLYKDFTFSGRISTGNTGNHRSAYVDLGNHAFSQKSIFLDKAYIKYKHNGWTAWLGKNSINLWKTNEILWDNDLKPEGIAISKKIHFFGDYVPEFKINTGFFLIGNNPYDSLPNPTTFDRQNNLSFFQLRTSLNVNRHRFILSPAFMHARLTKSLSYNMLAVMFRYGFFYRNRYYLYANYYHNLSHYKNQNPIDHNLRNQKSGFDIGISFPYQQFRLKLMYAYIEKYAVIDFLSQDNWLLPAVDHSQSGSNFKGWSAQLNYLISHGLSVALNLWYAQQIQHNITQNGLFEATRMRLEFNYRF